MATYTASSSSSAACLPKKYDVFISFRGEDTRSNFTSHLHNAFCTNQIVTYTDNRLHKGDEISSALMQAIQDSYVSVVVLSENYATSRWCLDELTKILQCKRDQGQLVIPVFYNVEPTDVRHQTGPYEQAFEEHDKKLHNQLKIYNWKVALREAASLVGWDSHTFRDESELIQKIVKDVQQKLKYRCKIATSSVNDNTSKYVLRVEEKYCYCNQRAALKISRTEKNPNRMYAVCENNKCKYFRWVKAEE